MHEHATAQILDGHAHALRNHMATLRAFEQWCDDTDVAADLATAASALQVIIERSVVAARIELGVVPRAITISTHDLVEFAVKRARREGAKLSTPIVPDEVLDVSVSGPGSWLERLMTDLMHVSVWDDGAQQFTTDDATVTMTCAVDATRWSDARMSLPTLAQACDAQLTCDGVRLTCELPQATIA